MKIAVLTDARANRPALEAALRAIDREDRDAVSHLGDDVGIGPSPAECLDLRHRTPNLRPVVGNRDARFAHGRPTPRPERMTDGELAHRRWVHARLDPALRPTVAVWPSAIREELAGGAVTCAHDVLDPLENGFLPVVPDPTPTDLDRLFAAERSALVCSGHHHPASDRTGHARYVDPGALGCSSDPLARFRVVAFDDGAFRPERRAAARDAASLCRAFGERDVPARRFSIGAFFGSSAPPSSVERQSGGVHHDPGPGRAVARPPPPQQPASPAAADRRRPDPRRMARPVRRIGDPGAVPGSGHRHARPTRGG